MRAVSTSAYWWTVNVWSYDHAARTWRGHALERSDGKAARLTYEQAVRSAAFLRQSAGWDRRYQLMRLAERRPV